MNKKLSFLVLVILSLTITLRAQAHEKKDAQRKDIHLFNGANSAPGKIVAALDTALKSGNKNKISSLLSKEVLIFEGGGVERSLAEYKSHHMSADIKFLSHVVTTKIEHQVVISGEMAVSSSRSKVSGNYRGKKINRTSMETIVLLKKHGQWKIIRIHWS